MKTKSDTAQRQAARKFVEYWTFQRGSEKGEDQQFWNSLLRDVLGVADVENVSSTKCQSQWRLAGTLALPTTKPPNYPTTKPNTSTRGFQKRGC